MKMGNQTNDEHLILHDGSPVSREFLNRVKDASSRVLAPIDVTQTTSKAKWRGFRTFSAASLHV